MNPWGILGIEETSDKTQIKRAYAKMLKVCHPEDDPEGFMKLRSAYEKAMEHAENAAKKRPDDILRIDNIELNTVEFNYKENIKDSDDWINDTYIQAGNVEDYVLYTQSCFQKVVSLYNDIFKRRDIECWNKLFLEFSISELEEIRDTAVEFFNINCCLPHEVWLLLDKEMSLSDHNKFIRSNLIKYDYGLSFDFLNPDIECDYNNYVRIRLLAFDYFNKGDYKTATESASEAEKLYDKDPVLFRISGISYYMLGENEKALEALSRALLLYGDDIDLLLYRGNTLIKKGDFLEAKLDFEKALELSPGSVGASKGIASCLFGLKKYKEAGKLIKELQKNSLQDLELDLMFYKIEQLKLFTKIKQFLNDEEVKEKTNIMKIITSRLFVFIFIVAIMPVIFFLMIILFRGFASIIIVLFILFCCRVWYVKGR